MKKRTVVKKQVDLLRKEWKDNTISYKTLLKNMRESYIRRLREIKGKREAATAHGKAHRAKRLICATYEIGFYELEGLNRIRGAPKIGSMSRRWRMYYMNPRYTFRFRL